MTTRKVLSKKQVEKVRWIIDWLRENGEPAATCLNGLLVDDYAERFNAKIKYMLGGANHCPQLNAILNAGYHAGYFTRRAMGLPNLSQGFPKWVYSFEPTKSNPNE